MKHATEMRKITDEVISTNRNRFNQKVENTCSCICEAIKKEASKGKASYSVRIKDKQLTNAVIRRYTKEGYKVVHKHFNLIKISW